MFLINVVVVLNVLIALGDCTLYPENGKKSQVKSGPVKYSVNDQNLVKQTPVAKEILNNYKAYHQDTSKRSSVEIVLGYVTPWNNHGYDVAKIFASKFTHISPVWLQVKRVGKNQYEIKGTHDIDKGWMKDVKKASSTGKINIVPRVIFDGWSKEDYISLLTSPEEKTAVARTFVDLCKTWKFDGLVIEVWSQIAGRFDNVFLIDLIRTLGTKLIRSSLDMILVIPPIHGLPQEMFDKKHFDALYNHVTAFSLMTYDYSNPQRPGPNSPINWVKKCIEELSPDVDKRSKILTGLNMYGNDYTSEGGGPIINNQYVQLLKSLKGKMSYDSESAEHFFETKDANGRHMVFYPTLYSISKRLDLIETMKTGCSIWELGQGLDYFYDLL